MQLFRVVVRYKNIDYESSLDKSGKMKKEIGLKNDKKDNKIRWELLPLDIINEIAKVYTKGAEKYSDNNWKLLGNGYERYKGALLRHLAANDKNPIDEETGCYHLAQVAWNAIAMLWFKLNQGK